MIKSRSGLVARCAFVQVPVPAMTSAVMHITKNNRNIMFNSGQGTECGSDPRWRINATQLRAQHASFDLDRQGEEICTHEAFSPCSASAIWIYFPANINILRPH
jgi:hypothetical protein